MKFILFSILQMAAHAIEETLKEIISEIGKLEELESKGEATLEDLRKLHSLRRKRANYESSLDRAHQAQQLHQDGFSQLSGNLGTQLETAMRIHNDPVLRQEFLNAGTIEEKKEVCHQHLFCGLSCSFDPNSQSAIDNVYDRVILYFADPGAFQRNHIKIRGTWYERRE